MKQCFLCFIPKLVSVHSELISGLPGLKDERRECLGCFIQRGFDSEYIENVPIC